MLVADEPAAVDDTVQFPDYDIVVVDIAVVDIAVVDNSVAVDTEVVGIGIAGRSEQQVEKPV